jgi:hypothetical protein
MTAALDPLDLGKGGNEPYRYERISSRHAQLPVQHAPNSSPPLSKPSMSPTKAMTVLDQNQGRMAAPGGKGLSLTLSVVPMNVQIVLREPRPPADATKQV